MNRSPVLLLPGLGVTGKQDARRAIAKEDGYRVVVGLGELSLVSEKSSSGGGAMPSSITPPGDAAYRWYSQVREDGGEHRRHEVQREVRADYG